VVMTQGKDVLRNEFAMFDSRPGEIGLKEDDGAERGEHNTPIQRNNLPLIRRKREQRGHTQDCVGAVKKEGGQIVRARGSKKRKQNVGGTEGKMALNSPSKMENERRCPQKKNPTRS